MNPTPPRQHGYVLLLTLVMVALVAAGTVGLTRASLASATEAKQAQASLQRRWAAISCRRVLLEQAPTRIEQRWRALIEPEDTEADADVAPVVPDRENLRVIHSRVRLGGLTIDVRLSDEQAKINVNALLREFEQEEAAGLIDGLTGANSQAITVNLRPIVDSTDTADTGNIPTLERVFADFNPHQVFDEPDTKQVPVDAITCWGNRRLRLSLASNAALRSLLSPHLGADKLERLLELRNDRPDITVDQAMRALSLGPSQSSLARRLLTDQSSCYSMWLTIRSEHRTWHELDIYQVDGEPQERYLTYLW